jgi:hypothetical protein
MKTLKTQGLGLILIGLSAVCAMAQDNSAKTVTNADLEKYRQARVKSDEDYRQNYQRLGLPSPEELERRETERQQRLSDLSEKLAARRLQNEYFERMNALAAAGDTPQIIYLDAEGNYGPAYSAGYVPYLFWGNRRRFNSNGKYPPNIQMVKDQADMFNDRFRFRGSRNRGRNAPGRVFSPRH